MPERKRFFNIFTSVLFVLLAQACTVKEAVPVTPLAAATPVEVGTGFVETLPAEQVTPSKIPLALIQQFGCVPGDHEVTSGRVLEVFDGDTISVKIGRLVYKVRYIGLNAPEHDEPLGPQAEDFNRSLVQGEKVYLVKDITEDANTAVCCAMFSPKMHL